MKRVRKRTINENRIMSFARFFELKIMTAKQIGVYCSCHGRSASKVLNENGVFRLPIVNAVDKLVKDGVGFDSALRIVGTTLEKYAHNYKVRKARGLL